MLLFRAPSNEFRVPVRRKPNFIHVHEKTRLVFDAAKQPFDLLRGIERFPIKGPLDDPH